MQATATGTRRRAWLAGLLGGCIAGWLAGRVAPVWAHPAGAFVRDAAGREVRVPQPVRGVFPAGGPAAILLYTLAPDLLLGWPRANRAAELPFLLPGVGDRPELGRLTGRGNTANLEQLLAQRPSLIVDSGSTRDTYVDLANRVQAQTGIPYLLLDGRFEQISPMYRLLGRALGRESRAEVLAWDPEVIVTIDRSFAATVRESPLWRRVSAVRTNRVHLSPKLPFGWVDFPPSVNRLPGLWWLGRAVHPEVFDLDLAKLTRDFYRLFYQVEPSTEQVGQVLDGRD